MEQEMIGKFISACRKEKGLTQMQLAEKLNITNRAVSKWETGKSMPDVSLMLDLYRTASYIHYRFHKLLHHGYITPRQSETFLRPLKRICLYLGFIS